VNWSSTHRQDRQPNKQEALMPTPEQTAATQEIDKQAQETEKQVLAATDAASDTVADLRAGNAAKTAADAAKAQTAADAAYKAYQKAKQTYELKKHLFEESGSDQEELEAKVLFAYKLALDAQNEADRAKLNSYEASGAAKAAVNVAALVVKKRKEARQKFLKDAEEGAAEEQFLDEASRERKKGGTPEDKARQEAEAQKLKKKADDAGQRKLTARAEGRQLEREANDLEGNPRIFEKFKP
jgi:hypothetical protein